MYSRFTKTDEIRLLTLCPGSPASPIECILSHCRLSSHPKYDALSYVWGSENGLTALKLNGERHFVRQNLFIALKHLRLEHEPRILWIDALCINQSNDGERGHQVTQMGMIYQGAAVVRVWLGLPDPSTDDAFPYLWRRHTAKQVLPKATKASTEGLKRLCMRDYWDRLWIIQEVLLAEKIEIHCGSLIMAWDGFANAVLEYDAVSHDEFDETTGEVQIVSDYAFKNFVRGRSVTKLCRQRLLISRGKSLPSVDGLSWLSLVRDHHAAHCTDVRDKIYGLQSFAPLCCKTAISIDYACSAYELCRRLLVHSIESHSSEHDEKLRVRDSLDLHALLVGGAMELSGVLPGTFDLGTLSSSKTLNNIPEDSEAKPDRVCNMDIQGWKYGQIRWTSPPLRSFCRSTSPIEVPVELLRASESEMGLMAHGPESTDLLAFAIDSVQHIGLPGSSFMNGLINGGPIKDEFKQPTVDLRIFEFHRSSTIGDEFAQILRAAKVRQIVAMQLFEILRFISQYLRNHSSHDDCVLFWSHETEKKSGVIGIAPVCARAGDVLCKFLLTDVIAIIRGDAEIVGRASRLTYPNCRWNERLGQNMRLQIDVRNLQILSTISNHCRPVREQASESSTPTSPQYTTMQDPTRSGIGGDHTIIYGLGRGQYVTSLQGLHRVGKENYRSSYIQATRASDRVVIWARIRCTCNASWKSSEVKSRATDGPARAFWCEQCGTMAPAYFGRAESESKIMRLTLPLSASRAPRLISKVRVKCSQLSHSSQIGARVTLDTPSHKCSICCALVGSDCPVRKGVRPEPYKCRWCPKKFTSLEAMRVHQVFKSSEWKCAVCISLFQEDRISGDIK